MRERTVGYSGLKVSEIGLGTLTWGCDTPEEEAALLLGALADAGGNLLDVSPAFGAGRAEEVLGSLFASQFERRDFVVCSRAAFSIRDGAMHAESGRGAILASVDATLERLDTSYLDVLLVALPDDVVPDDETADALSYLVSSGRVRYIGLMAEGGLPGYPSWRTASLARMMLERRMPSLVALGAEYSVLERSFEESFVDMAEHFGLGLFAMSPLGRGALTGKYRHSTPPASRAASEHLAPFVDPYLHAEPRRLVEAVAKAADGLGRRPADVSLAWVLSHPFVSSAILGSRTAKQFTSVLEGLEVLPDLVIDAIDDVSRPGLR